MKLLLINPSTKGYAEPEFWDYELVKKIFGLHVPPPLSLPTIAALTPPEVEVKIIDENIEDINFDEKVDLVGIGAMTLYIPRAYQIADEFRRRGVMVVLGGIHATMLPAEAIEHADSVVLGEAEYVWKRLVADFKNRALQRFYKSDESPDLADSPAPRIDLLKNEKYSMNQLQITRGCPFDCEFCSVKVFSGKNFRHKRIEQVIQEIAALPKEMVINICGSELKLPKPIFFTDDNLIGNKNYAKELFKALTPLKLSGWTSQASINLAKDKELLHLMKEAGCRYILIGLESVAEESLIEMGKKANRLDEYHEARKLSLPSVCA